MSYPLEQRAFNSVEENAIYYAARYVIRKLLWKHDNLRGEDSKQLAAMLWGMLGDDCCGIDATASYYDYVKSVDEKSRSGQLETCFK